MRLENGAIDTCTCSGLLPSTSKMCEEDWGDEQESEIEITNACFQWIFQYYIL